MSMREVSADHVDAQDILYDVVALEQVLRSLYGQVTAQAHVINAGVDRLDTPTLRLKQDSPGQYRLELEAQVLERSEPTPFIRYRCTRHGEGQDADIWGTTLQVAKHIVSHTSEG